MGSNLHDKIYCANCGYWAGTKPNTGYCMKYSIRTEWCAGVRWMTKDEFAPCPGFRPLTNPLTDLERAVIISA